MAATDTQTRTALYHRPNNRGRWKLFDVYASRDEAFRAVDQLPDRHPVFRLEDVPAPTPEPDPTKFPEMLNMLTELSDKTAVNPLPNVTPADLQRIGQRFAAVGRVVGPLLAEVQAAADRVWAEEIVPAITADLERADAVASEVFARLGEEAAAG